MKKRGPDPSLIPSLGGVHQRGGRMTYGTTRRPVYGHTTGVDEYSSDDIPVRDLQREKMLEELAKRINTPKTGG